MTGSLSDYDQGLLDQIGLFADTRLAEQVRAVMVARNNAETQLAEARLSVRKWKTGCGDWMERANAAEAGLEVIEALIEHPGVVDTLRAALSVAPQPEPDEVSHVVTDASDDPEHADDCPGCTSGTEDHDVYAASLPVEPGGAP